MYFDSGTLRGIKQTDETKCEGSGEDKGGICCVNDGPNKKNGKGHEKGNSADDDVGK